MCCTNYIFYIFYKSTKAPLQLDGAEPGDPRTGDIKSEAGDAHRPSEDPFFCFLLCLPRVHTFDDSYEYPAALRIIIPSENYRTSVGYRISISESRSVRYR